MTDLIARAGSKFSVTIPKESGIEIDGGGGLTMALVNIGIPGAQGPQGIPGAGPTTQRIAGENLGGGRAVVSLDGLAYYADQSIPNHATIIMGITKNAVSTGEPVTIQSLGELNGFSGLTPDMPIFLGVNGNLTQITPTTGFILQLAAALAPDTINISLKFPLQKA